MLLSLFDRFFFHHDQHNPFVHSLDEFAAEIVEFVPDLVVLGGLQMMDNFPFEQSMPTIITKHISLCINHIICIGTKKYRSKIN